MIYKPDVNQWNDPPDGPQGESFVGYKSRNQMIARDCDVLFCIVPVGIGTSTNPAYCYHCKEHGHFKNGGCWTMNYAKKLGKETHLVIIG